MAGLLHGGVTFSLMDEALGWAVYFQGLYEVTARSRRLHKDIREPQQPRSVY
jgi:acyl-coenzyme A thioesterase PaaI-like protein